jgi:MFS family permease
LQGRSRDLKREVLQPANFIGGVWHGAFLAIGRSLVDTNTVIAAFIADLTGSSFWVGGLAALLMAAGAVPQVLVARFVEPLRRERGVLLAAIYLRSLCWAGLGLLLSVAGVNRPKLVLWGLVVLLALFSAGGALGGVPYTDIIGKVIPARMRGRFLAVRQASGSLLSIGAAALAGVVLHLDYPTNYATLFFLSALSLSIASLGVWAIREPPATEVKGQRLDWVSYFRSLGEPLRAIRTLAVVSVSTGFCLMAMPFYIVTAKKVFDAPSEATAFCIGALVLGSLLGDFAWGKLVDRFGSRRMILSCVVVSAITPVVALLAWVVGWQILVLVIGLMGATTAGRSIGFTSALLEIAPADRRAIYTATYALTYVPLAVMPLLGGAIAEVFSFKILFILTALAMLTSVAVVWKWNQAAKGYATRDGSVTLKAAKESTLL